MGELDGEPRPRGLADQDATARHRFGPPSDVCPSPSRFLGSPAAGDMTVSSVRNVKRLTSD